MIRGVIGVAACAALLLATAGTAAAAPLVPFNEGWGGSGVVAGYHHENLCEKHQIEPGASRRARIRVTPYREVAGPDRSWPQVQGTLMCAPLLEIWAHRAGPWDVNAPGGPNWLSIRCPASEVPASNGAGFWASERHLTQTEGGFGSHRDGYWHYRFHNWTSGTVTIQFWAVCLNHATRVP